MSHPLTALDRDSEGNAMQDRLLQSCERCQQGEPQVTLSVCCSSHGKTLCHRDYRLTHFVEVCGCSRCEGESLPRIYPPRPLPPPNRLLGHTADGHPARPL